MKETNIKLFPVLDGLCGRTTPSTPASFRPDLWTLQAAVSEYEMEERTFYWLPRSGGGLPCPGCSRGWSIGRRRLPGSSPGALQRRADVFLRGSHGHRVWISQRPEAGEEAYCVILKGRDRDSPTGDIRSFDFSAHLHRLEHTAVEAKAVELVFYSGRRFSMEPERYRAAMEDLFWEYGTLRRIRYLPENEAALVRTIMMEHRYQKGWMPKKDRAPPSGPVR